MSYQGAATSQPHSSESLLRQNAALKQRVAVLQEQLEVSHMDEQQLRRKLEEINSTRSYITDQLNLLSRDYDERVKQLEGKIDRLGKLNDKLLKENSSFREEQLLWESRFMEKERLLIGLLGQHQESLPVTAIIQRGDPYPRELIIAEKLAEPNMKRPQERSIDLRLDERNEDEHIEKLLSAEKPIVSKAFSCEDFNRVAPPADLVPSDVEHEAAIMRKEETFSQRPERKSPGKQENEVSMQKSSVSKQPPKSQLSSQAEQASTQTVEQEPREQVRPLPYDVEPPKSEAHAARAPPPPQSRHQPPPLKPKPRIKNADAVALQFVEEASQPKPPKLVAVPAQIQQQHQPEWLQSLASSEPITQSNTSEPPPQPGPANLRPAPPPPPEQKQPKPKRKIIADAKNLNFNEPSQPVPERPPFSPPAPVLSPEVVTHQSPELLHAELDQQFQLHHEEPFASEEHQQQINAQAFFAGIAHSEISEIPHNDDITATHYFVPGQQVQSDYPQDSFAMEEQHSHSMTESVNFFDALGRTPVGNPPPPQQKKPRRSKQLKVMDPSAFN